MSPGSVGLEALEAEGRRAMGMLPALRPAWVSSFSFLLWTLFPKPRWSSGGGGAPAFPWQGPVPWQPVGGAAPGVSAPVACRQGRSQAQGLLGARSPQVRPGMWQAGAGVLRGAGVGQGSHRAGTGGGGPVGGGVLFPAWGALPAVPCRVLRDPSPIPHPTPSSYALRGWGPPLFCTPGASEVVRGSLSFLSHRPPGGAEAQSQNLAGASVSALGFRPPNPRTLSPEPPMKGSDCTLPGPENPVGTAISTSQNLAGRPCLRGDTPMRSRSGHRGGG